ncbi:MICOS complex subunit [Pleurostoma richardsiae]|uniref:MICOS complex subunit n=1 Tax=Pleurostoma richardsiae TaxID=41990 RepID=A0AA38VR33_9PEZI|nr:MICOS complex subunit [Pleurostoma richardsiae]
MAARVLLQRHAAPLAASLLVGGVVLSPRVALAEAPEAFKQPKKPIYDDFDAPPTSATLPPVKAAPIPVAPATSAPTSQPAATEQTPRPHGPTPTDRLAAQIRVARLYLYRQASAAEDAVNAAMDRAFHLERSFTDTLASLAPPRESGERLMPGLIYVLVAAMAGSIVTRRSNILLRATVPAAFGMGAGWAVIPVTMRNTADLAWTYEQRFPAVAEAHVRTRESVEKAWSFARVHADVGARMLDEKVGEAREAVEGWVRKGK